MNGALRSLGFGGLYGVSTLFWCLLWVLGPTTLAKADSAGQDASRQHYQVFRERNPFVRHRQRPAEELISLPRSEPRPPERDEGYLVLRGIVQVDGEFGALIEDIRTGVVQRYRFGDSPGRGQIVGMTIDSVTVADGDHRLEIYLGRNLEGAAAPSAAASQPGMSGSEAVRSTSAAPEAASDSRRAIIERLRQRRQEETMP